MIAFAALVTCLLCVAILPNLAIGQTLPPCEECEVNEDLMRCWRIPPCHIPSTVTHLKMSYYLLARADTFAAMLNKSTNLTKLSLANPFFSPTFNYRMLNYFENIRYLAIKLDLKLHYEGVPGNVERIQHLAMEVDCNSELDFHTFITGAEYTRIMSNFLSINTVTFYQITKECSFTVINVYFDYLAEDSPFIKNLHFNNIRGSVFLHFHDESKASSMSQITIENSILNKVRKFETFDFSCNRCGTIILKNTYFHFNELTVDRFDSASFLCVRVKDRADDVKLVIYGNMRALIFSNNTFLLCISNSTSAEVFFYISEVQKIDLSSNGMECFSAPLIMDNTVPQSVTKLVLRDNKLGLMQRAYPDVFADSFCLFTSLQFLDLSQNDMTEIPGNLFDNNTDLISLNLSENRLAKLHIESIIKLKLLQDFDISSNLIKTISRQEMVYFDSFVTKSAVKMYLNSNTIECMCNDVELLWLNKHSASNLRVPPNERVCAVTSHSTVPYSDYNDYCEQQHIHTVLKHALPTISGISLLAILVCLIMWWHARKRRKMANFVRNIRHDQNLTEYLVFLSCSSGDNQIIYKVIIPRLNQHLINRTGRERDYICTGDTHFRPGFNVVQEAIRCIELCSVTIFAISNSFVDKPYCQMEIKEALDQLKPIILIMIEDVDENDMCRIVRNVFKRYTRFRCVQVGTGYDVRPSWDLLVTLILELAMGEEEEMDRRECKRRVNGQQNENIESKF